MLSWTTGGPPHSLLISANRHVWSSASSTSSKSISQIATSIQNNKMEQHQTMISILAQERLLGAILGAALTGFLVFELRKSIYQPISPKNKER